MLKLKIILVLLRCLVKTLRQVSYLHVEQYNCLGVRKGVRNLLELQGSSCFSKYGLEKDQLLAVTITLVKPENLLLTNHTSMTNHTPTYWRKIINQMEELFRYINSFFIGTQFSSVEI